ncbi:zinc transporter ZIP11 [Nilaparvata lugens]|uniref:zinc transporter ZIP11 n=1 Tax=Nilaparvata lugens TaxID=108931 RepID=UPI00193D5A8F|nr:zinc transporter ZIP11 [Nilaparvata lugens]
MIQGYSPIVQTLLGTLFTWGLTAAGAALVIVIRGKQRKLLDTSLGFAGGVMIAASYWSLLAPAIEMAEESNNYGPEGEYAVVPIAIGFVLGCLFVFIADLVISQYGLHSPSFMLADMCGDSVAFGVTKRRKLAGGAGECALEGACGAVAGAGVGGAGAGAGEGGVDTRWKRVLLLLIAITVHNIPEGMVVGVGFAAIGSSPSATFQNARNLAIGIGIQNFPEGLAVSLPLQAAGYSTLTSFWFGQLSGMVEPVFGILGALAVTMAKPLLPYALSFAAGAMVYVVFDDIVPEAHASGNGRLATWGAIVGFITMMSLDVGLG